MLYYDGGAKLFAKLLWTNPSPNSVFAPKQIMDVIVVNVNGIKTYDYLVFVTRNSVSDSREQTSIIPAIPYDASDTTASSFTISNFGTNSTYRVCAMNSLGVLQVAQGYTASATGNNYCIPLKIYGIKGKIGGI